MGLKSTFLFISGMQTQKYSYFRLLIVWNVLKPQIIKGKGKFLGKL